ncbi:MAG TPA: DUF2889 domain-containing protein [Candidatus Limnocylindria bacterium]|nr:DUF2889 domain-containing protein [Candidatus Limnocylindria bacterium]
MDLDLRGHPLHSRALGIGIAQRADGRLDVAGTLLDLRKRGFVPVGGDLHGSGIVHHMLLDVVVDPASGRVEAASARQPSVAFEASAATEGESCRDPIATAGALVGGNVARGWPERVGDALGGPKACFHVFTLAHFLGGTTAWALGRERARFAGVARAAGQRVYRRDVVIDGAQLPDGGLVLGLQLTDMLFAPVDGVVPAMQRLGEHLEMRIQLTLRAPEFATTGVAVAERRRDPSCLDVPWRPRPDVAAHLDGISLLRGATATLLARFGEPGDDRPHLDAALMLAPTLIQVFAAVADWASTAARDRWLLGMGGRPDSCWMWRRGGALARLRTPDDPARL